MNTKVKTKIRYNGQDYSDPSQLPPDIRAAYENALNDVGHSRSVVKRKFSLNGQVFGNENGMPAGVSNLYDDVMSVIENNGEVTLPNSRHGQPLLSSGQWKFVVGVTVGLLSAATYLALRSLH